jgi:hypothetical protein
MSAELLWRGRDLTTHQRRQVRRAHLACPLLKQLQRPLTEALAQHRYREGMDVGGILIEIVEFGRWAEAEGLALTVRERRQVAYATRMLTTMERASSEVVRRARRSALRVILRWCVRYQVLGNLRCPACGRLTMVHRRNAGPAAWPPPSDWVAERACVFCGRRGNLQVYKSPWRPFRKPPDREYLRRLRDKLGEQLRS